MIIDFYSNDNHLHRNFINNEIKISSLPPAIILKIKTFHLKIKIKDTLKFTLKYLPTFFFKFRNYQVLFFGGVQGEASLPQMTSPKSSYKLRDRNNQVLKRP